MKIELHEITIRDIAKNYVDNAEEGVIGYNYRLNIRPKYQREFVYDERKRDAVIDSICKGFPLNVMYWVKNEDGTFEVLDGQQRTISFCQYVHNLFVVDKKYLHNLTNTEREQILSYKCMVYFCEGNDKEKLDWFKIINIAGEKLTDQELRNAVYTGPWLSDAKAWFSRTGCPAAGLAKTFVNGSPIRQEVLETAIRWRNKGDIEEYMALHQHDPNANELWTYFQNVIGWVKLTFPEYRNEMKGIEWGGLYDEFKDKIFDTVKLEREIETLMMDDDVSNKKGVYAYVLTHNEKHLNIRAFTASQKRSAYERQKGVCSKCSKQFKENEMEADHITPWSKGGPTSAENCQMLCKDCNRRKSDS